MSLLQKNGEKHECTGERKRDEERKAKWRLKWLIEIEIGRGRN